MILNYTIEEYKNKQDWLKGRKKSFGGSSVSALLNCSPYTKPIDIYCSSVNPSEDKKDKVTVSTEYGHNCEHLLSQLFAINFPKYKGHYETKKIIMARRNDKHYMSYTPDELCEEVDTGRKGFIEYKTHIIKSQEDYEEWSSGSIPQNYYCQLLQGFAVMNDKEFCELYVILNWLNYDTGCYEKSELRHFHLERETCKDDIELLEKIETDFQVNHLDKRCPPDIEINL